MAEAHPVGFRWVMKAKERGATIIHVDPRFSRTSALADIWVPIRAGSDIAFLGGLVRHIIENELFFGEYVVNYTNASCILRDDYQDPEDKADGFFSGWNEGERNYSMQSWLYKGEGLSFPERDFTLRDPQCVFQKLKRHFARYTPEMVEKVCGIPPALFHKVADALVRASGPDKTAAICYAVGWTQHSKGVQIIRTASILQLLLGNIGRPGGGILALRGHASIQGSTDIPTLYDILPGYLAMPRGGAEETLQRYLDTNTTKTGLWSNTPAYFVSLLKAYYGKQRDRRKRFRLQLAAENYRGPFVLRISLRDGGRENGRHVLDWTEFCCRRAELAFSTEVDGETKMVCHSRHGGNRASQILARLCGN